ncbi:MAG: DUF4097 domain-containing protein [Defluviitaleaceae bacterium]|nr:DUF4097 domain-containing protein [Defluviitaleaceae bacterium]MCL2836515.1 DUF4097 domain-containing protein [Defluviitaleaceae bacterium]
MQIGNGQGDNGQRDDRQRYNGPEPGRPAEHPRYRGNGRRILGLSAAVLIIIIILASVFFNVARASHTYTNSYSYVTYTGGVRNINIETSSANVRVVETGGGELRMTVNGRANYEPDLAASNSGDTISIRFDKDMRFSLINSYSNLELTVEIPRDYAGNLTVTTSSGRIELNDSGFNDVTLRASSGNIRIRDLSCQNLRLNTSSGRIEAESLTVTEGDIRSTSGNVILDKANGGSLNIRTSSGRINVGRADNADIRANASSGNVEIKYVNFDNDLNIGTSSGRINLYLPSNAEYVLDVTTSSGSINSEFHNFTRDQSNERRNRFSGRTSIGAVNEIKLSASSGNVNIKTN